MRKVLVRPHTTPTTAQERLDEWRRQGRIVDYHHNDRPDACWFWRGTVDSAGAPVFMLNRRVTRVWDDVYGRLLVGNGEYPYPTVCNFRLCVNPAHLGLTTRGERRRWRNKAFIGGFSYERAKAYVEFHCTSPRPSLMAVAAMFGLSRAQMIEVANTPVEEAERNGWITAT